MTDAEQRIAEIREKWDSYRYAEESYDIDFEYLGFIEESMDHLLDQLQKKDDLIAYLTRQCVASSEAAQESHEQLEPVQKHQHELGELHKDLLVHIESAGVLDCEQDCYRRLQALAEE